MNEIFQPIESTSLKIVILFAAAIVTSLILHTIIFQVIKISYRHKKDAISTSLKRFKAPSFFFLAVISFSVYNTILEFNVNTNTIMNHILIVAIIISLAWFAINGVKLAKYFILQKYDISAEDNLQARKVTTQLRVFERIIITVILIVAISTGLMTFEDIRKIGVNLLASAGIAGIIIGLAAQKSISNIIAGIQLALTQPIRIDDVLIVENEWGRVEEINLTYVVLKIWDQRRLIIPLTYFIDKPFQNWTRTSAELLGTVFLYLDYSVEIDVIREELNNILKDNALWDKRLGIVQVTNATDKTMEVRLLVSAKDASTAFDLRVLIREKMISFLQKNYPESLPKVRIEKQEIE